jgi:hypothetical protein
MTEERCYRIIRFYKSGKRKPRTIKTGLTLQEAQAHCNDPETSSSTATKADYHTLRRGPWFDGYDTMRGMRRR